MEQSKLDGWLNTIFKIMAIVLMAFATWFLWHWPHASHPIELPHVDNTLPGDLPGSNDGAHVDNTLPRPCDGLPDCKPTHPIVIPPDVVPLPPCENCTPEHPIVIPPQQPVILPPNTGYEVTKPILIKDFDPNAEGAGTIWVMDPNNTTPTAYVRQVQR